MQRAVLSPYDQELSQFRLVYSRAGVIVSMVLVLFGIGLDFFIYPQHFWALGRARLLTVGLSFLIFEALKLPLRLRLVVPLTLLWLSLPQVMIAWMIWYTEGVNSIYFVGLHLALYATGIVLSIGFFENIGFSLFTYAVYVVACYSHPRGLQDIERFMGISLFILFSGTISSGCTYFNERARKELFRLQARVAQQNAELLQANQLLEKTNEALAQVKGQMIQQEKMAALGTLSAGLLHEVNNPVNYSLMALNMALYEPEVAQNASLKEAITDAKDGMQRVQAIVTDLKTFAYQKPGEVQHRIFLLEKAIRSALRLTAFELKGIEVALDLPLDTHVLGDEPALIGVLINLLSNASLALRKRQGEASPRIDIVARRDGGRLYLSVRDNGSGIKPENLNRVFEPFFTTRDVGQGLGLGLSMSYSIIQRHGGTLGVASEEGAWTEFSFDLALADQGV